MNIHELRKQAAGEIIDYPFLISALQSYARPRDKITTWLASGELIRVKKGLYVFGKEGARQAYSELQLANLIYGPSAISLTYALSYYGMIPEKVVEVTSITFKRDKIFLTPIGRYTYRYLSLKKYPIGIEWIKSTANQAFFIASREKAICDHLLLTDKIIQFKSLTDVEAYLLHDMRIDESALRELNTETLLEISAIYHDARLIRLHQFINAWKRK